MGGEIRRLSWGWWQRGGKGRVQRLRNSPEDIDPAAPLHGAERGQLDLDKTLGLSAVSLPQHCARLTYLEVKCNADHKVSKNRQEGANQVFLEGKVTEQAMSHTPAKGPRTHLTPQCLLLPLKTSPVFITPSPQRRIYWNLMTHGPLADL